jgi:23S rRNA-/tRNA-specific pseudouridylate synthase
LSTLPADYWDSLPLGREVHVLNRDTQGLVAFDKPAGLLSHPNQSADEVRSLLVCRYDAEGQCFSWKTAEGSIRRLWLLNRLDGATSGVILCAATELLARTIKEQFAKKQVRKNYCALVFGKPAEKAVMWRDLVAVSRKGGKVRTQAMAGNIPALTKFQFLKHGQAAFSTSLIRLEPQTGRSHQLRVQCAKRHLPIIGDQTYGDFGLNRAFAKSFGTKRLFLHSLETQFGYEFAGKTHEFKASAPLPAEFQAKY